MEPLPQHMVVAAAHVVYAAVFLALGIGVRRRFRGAPVAAAARGFVVWWHLMAAQAATIAAIATAAALGFDGGPLFVGLIVMSQALAAAQVWALGSYVIYIWSGGGRAGRAPLVLFLMAYALYFALLITRLAPTEAIVDPWTFGLALPLTSGAIGVVATLFFLPIFTILGAWVALAFEAPSNTQRVRVLVLGATTALWNVAQSIHFAGDGVIPSGFTGALLALNLFWAGVLVLTYYPPAAIQRAFRVRSLAAESMDTRPRD